MWGQPPSAVQSSKSSIAFPARRQRARPNPCHRAYNKCMNRPLLIAALLLLTASIPVLAQRGGGHASFGGHGGMAGHASFGGHAGGGRSFSGARSSPGFAGRNSVRGSFSSHRSFSSNRSFSYRSSRGFHDRDDRFRRHGFRNNCYGYACRGYGYPWWYAGAFDPYWWGDSDSSYDQDQQNNAALAAEMNAQSLDEQRMRQQADHDQDVYASSAAPSAHREERAQLGPATVLVFRDQHQQEVQNYAIVGQTLWNFSAQHTQKIPLSDLDLVATAKANDERGVDFRVPGTHEGQ